MYLDTGFYEKATFEQIEELNKRNTLGPNAPVWGYIPDWLYEIEEQHKEDPMQNGKKVDISTIKFPIFRFLSFIYVRQLAHSVGAKLHILYYDDKVEDIKDKIDGLLIPGGRDLDPKFYGQENKGSKVPPGDSEKRWFFTKRLFEELPPKMPILGICYGYQVLNCLLGGDMIQDLPTAQEHYQKRRFEVLPGSRIAEALQGDVLVGKCSHHQNLGKIPSCLKVTVTDPLDNNMPHAIEYQGSDRNIIGLLWHPEATYENTRLENIDSASLKIMRQFCKDCLEFRKNR